MYIKRLLQATLPLDGLTKKSLIMKKVKIFIHKQDVRRFKSSYLHVT